jgi:hypothetical protein
MQATLYLLRAFARSLPLSVFKAFRLHDLPQIEALGVKAPATTKTTQIVYSSEAGS